MILKIDRSSATPLSDQIVNEIKLLVDQGIIGIGQPLSSTRGLAQKLGVNRSTVVRAYEELQALGYLHSQDQRERNQRRPHQTGKSPARLTMRMGECF